MLAAAPCAEWRALIALGYYTGARLTDLARLTWGAWDRGQNAIGFKQKKTGGAVWVPVHPGLAARLSELPAGIAKAPLLPRLATKGSSGKAGLSAQFRKAMERAGIAPGIARARPGPAGRSVSRLSFHSLRHSFTSELARAGVPPEIRQQLTGHADLGSHKTYTHLELESFRGAIAALPALP